MADETTVPEVTSLDQIYAPEALLAQGKRWNDFLEKFDEIYGVKADFVARCPGRVNLIGEHIDYMLYEVMPMAVAVDLLIAVSVVPPSSSSSSSSTVEIANVFSSKFPSKTFTISATGEVEIDDTTHEWSNYFKCGVRGAMGLLHSKGWNEKPAGMKVLVHGTVPSGAGLSSSAAFTCASALSVLAANGQEKIDKGELVNLAIVSERFVGVNSGGMDQTASIYGSKDHALYVSFSPSLKASHFSFPKSDPAFVFLIAQTFVQADKRLTAPIHYNLRVVETTLAAQVLAKKCNVGPLPEDQGALGYTLRGFQEKYFEKRKSEDGKDIKETEQLEILINLVKEVLDKGDSYTSTDIAEILDLTPASLTAKYMTRFPVRAEKFKLLSRATHVFSEALRVKKFAELMYNAPPSASLSYLESLGNLMNESQASCRDLYDCSCGELDLLCEIAKKAGSVGSRLTGAGWGGCTVHLVPEGRVKEVEEALREGYYKEKFPKVVESEEGWRSAVVVSKPGSGAMIYKVPDA